MGEGFYLVFNFMSTPTRTRSDVKREAIINAAKEAFKTFGVLGTSMDKLAEMAQVSKRTVYNHFRAKEDLVMYLIKAQYQDNLINVDATYCPTSSLAEQLQSLVQIQIDFTSDQEQLDLARVVIGHFFYEPDKLHDEFSQLNAQETFFHRWLSAAKADGRLDFEDVNHVCDEIGGLIKGQCFWPQLFKVQPPLSDSEKLRIAKSTTQMILLRYQCSQHNKP